MHPSIEELRSLEYPIPTLDKIEGILESWYSERTRIANKMADKSPVQEEYKIKTELKLRNLLKYIEENFNN